MQLNYYNDINNLFLHLKYMRIPLSNEQRGIRDPLETECRQYLLWSRSHRGAAQGKLKEIRSAIKRVLESGTRSPNAEALLRDKFGYEENILGDLREYGEEDYSVPLEGPNARESISADIATIMKEFKQIEDDLRNPESREIDNVHRIQNLYLGIAVLLMQTNEDNTDRGDVERIMLAWDESGLQQYIDIKTMHRHVKQEHANLERKKEIPKEEE